MIIKKAKVLRNKQKKPSFLINILALYKTIVEKAISNKLKNRTSEKITNKFLQEIKFLSSNSCVKKSFHQNNHNFIFVQ